MASGILDYVVMAASILICVLISYLSKRKDNKKQTVDKFLLGNRKMALLPVAFSAFATVLSANSITSVIGESFANGMQLSIYLLVLFLIQVPAAFLIVPVFHNMRYDSVFEYIQRRFDRSLMLFMSAESNLIYLLYNSLFLYVPSICFSTVSDIPYWVILTISGVVCTSYCVIGGLKAVIWTDLFQSILVFLSVIIVTIVGFQDVGGIKNAWSATFDGKLRQHFKLTEDLNSTYTVWNITAFGVVIGFYHMASSQAVAQRILCVKDYKTARDSFLLCNVLGALMMILVFFASVAVFAFLVRCNPLVQPNSTVRLPDQLYIFVTSKLFEDVPGVLGLAMAGIISAALSSISSLLNGLATSILQDFITPLFPNLQMKESKKVVLCKVVTAMLGCLTILFALAIPHVGGAVHVMLLIAGAFSGPRAGIYTLAFFCRKASTKACKIALGISLMLSGFLSIGSFVDFPHKPQFIHSGGHDCEDYFEVVYNTNDTSFITFENYTAPVNVVRKPSIFLYGISTFWFPLINAVISFSLGFVLSYLFRNEKETDIRLFSPIVLNQVERETIERMKNKLEKDGLLLDDVAHVVQL